MISDLEWLEQATFFAGGRKSEPMLKTSRRLSFPEIFLADRV
jgi:hypothetical protein